MLRCTEIDGAITFTVRVAPRAAQSRVVGEHDGALRVRVAAPPAKGAANEELVRILALALRVRPSAVEIATGHGSKAKQVRVYDIDCASLQSLIAGSGA